jgi:hypothetical protein
MADAPERDNMLEDTTRVVLKVILEANEPLTVKTIREILPRPFKVEEENLTKILDEQAGQGMVFLWLPWRSKKRFWKKDPEYYCRKTILELLSRQPMTRSELHNALRKRMFGCSKSKAEELTRRHLHSLLEEHLLYRYPLMPRQRARRFCVNPPDPAPYLAKVKKEFEAVCNKLKPAAVSPEKVYESLGDILALHQEQAHPSAETSRESLSLPEASELILKKVAEIEPAAGQQALVSIRELRSVANLPAETFDRAVLQLADQGKIWLHRHAYPAQAKQEDVVKDDRGNYYMGIVLRR